MLARNLGTEYQANGIMNGYTDKRFKPDQKLTRAEAVAILNRLFKRGPLYGVGISSFKDVSTSHWAFHEVEESAREHHWEFDKQDKEIMK